MCPATVRGWRVLPVEEGPAAPLLERSLSLLERLADDPVPVLRWYRTRTPAIVLGRGQGSLVLRPVDGLTVTMRSSGGGAVLLDPGMLALDILLPSGHPWVGADPGAVFLHVGRVWRRALAQLGVPDLTVHDGASTTPRRTDERGRLVAALCYASVGRGEVLAAGRKLVGLAQRRRRHGTLVQCGLLRSWRPAALLEALGADPGDPSLTGVAVGLDELLEAPPAAAAVIAAVQGVVTGQDASLAGTS